MYISNLTLIEWTTKSVGKKIQRNTSVNLQDITLGQFYWKTINLNLDIINCDLGRGSLNITGNEEQRSRNNKSTAQRVPFVVLNNSTIKNLIGTHIRLRISDSSVLVNTDVDIVSPVFVMRFSVVQIINCIFYGIRNMRPKDPTEHVGNFTLAAILIDVGDSRLIIRDCIFKDVQVDMRYKTSAVLYSENSQVNRGCSGLV